MLEINFGILAVQSVTFLIAVVCLWFTCWKPLCTALRERRDAIKRDLDLVTQTKAAMAGIEADYSRKLAQIHSEKEAILSEARAEGERQKGQIIRLAREEAKELALRSAQSVRAENNKLLMELYREISGLSLDLAEKLMRKSIKKEDQFQFVHEALDELQKSG